jgi:serine/threonine-protein kinase HipA
VTAALDPRAVEVLDVHVGSTHVGELRRTTQGASFRYLDEVLGAELAVGFRMPVQKEPFVVRGANLHPFFAGLLPEGLRLRALVRGLKTSEDDMYSMLAAVGGDTVGAVSVALPGTAPIVHEPSADLDHPEGQRFLDLLERSLRWDAALGRPGERHALAGVQPKVSAGMISFPVRVARAHAAPAPCILKLEPADLPHLVANEHFFMNLARDVGLEVASVRLLSDREGRPGLLVARFDRSRDADGRIDKHAQEDACQLLDRYPADKYRVPLRAFAEALEVCTAPAAERLRLLELVAFSYLIANGDLHAKNLSVRRADGMVRLAPAYDLLTTLPYGDDTMALPLEGRDTRLGRADFVAFGERAGVRRAATERMLSNLVSRLRRRLAATDRPDLGAIGFDAKATRHLERTMQARCDALVGG